MEVSFSVGRGSGASTKNKIRRGLDNGGGGAYAIYMNNRSNERMLKKSKLVKYRRKGKTVFYSLADSHVRTILGQGMEHVTE